MPEALDRATQHVVPEDLSGMVLDKEELPDELQGFEIGREGVLDNETMAAQGFPGSTTGETRATGRITGYLREFYDPVEPGPEDTGANIIGATVVHLFENEEAVWGWMKEKFLGEFQRFVGKELENQQQLVSADELQFDGFSDRVVGLRTLQTSQFGPVSSTIVDFRVGRLLGVTYLVAVGDVPREHLVGEMGRKLERKIVSVVLGSS